MPVRPGTNPDDLREIADLIEAVNREVGRNLLVLESEHPVTVISAGEPIASLTVNEDGTGVQV